MARYDPTIALIKKQQKEAWENFVIKSKSKKKLDDTFQVVLYVEAQLKELEECRREIQKYKQFFNTLNEFLPRKFSTNRPLIF